MSSGRDEDTVEPLLDTWRHFKYAASWMWSCHSKPVSDGACVLNPWGASQLAGLLEALRHLARLRTALFNGPPGAPLIAAPEYAWKDQAEKHSGFERRVLDALRTSPGTVTSVEMTFDLHVWVRTAMDQAPVRGWVRDAAEGDFQFELNHSHGAFSMDHTLFRDGATHGDSNAVLHRLNSPLLKDALAAIEERLGPIEHVEGLEGVTRSGFASIS